MSTFYNSSTQIRKRCPLKKPEYYLSFLAYDTNGMYIVTLLKKKTTSYCIEDASGTIEMILETDLKLEIDKQYVVFGHINKYLYVDSIKRANFYEICIKLLPL